MAGKKRRKLKAWIYFPLSLMLAIVASIVFVLAFRGEKKKEPIALQATSSEEMQQEVVAAPTTQPVSTVRLFAYRDGDKWGYKNQTGDVVIQAKYKEAKPFSEEYAWVKDAQTDRYGLIDQSGNEYGGFIYEDVRSFHEGFAAVKRENTWGYANTMGVTQKPAVYSAAWDFHNGYARVSKDEKFYYINTNEEEISEKKYERASDFAETTSDTLAFVGEKDSGGSTIRYYIINPTTTIKGIGGVEGTIYSQDRAAVKLESGLYTFYDAFGNDAMARTFEEALNFSDDLAAVREGDRWGYVNAEGEFTIPAMYQEAQSFSEGFAAVRNELGWFYIDKAGTRVTDSDVVYAQAEPFSQGYAQVVLGNSAMVINSSGVVSGELYKMDPAELSGSYRAIIKTTSGNSLNMRAMPSAEADIMLGIPTEAEVAVLETVDGWCRIQYQDATGYVKREFVFKKNE